MATINLKVENHTTFKLSGELSRVRSNWQSNFGLKLNSSLSSSPLSSSITPSLQAQNLPFQQILPTVDFFYVLDCLTIVGLDRTYHTYYFIYSFTF